MMNAIRNLLGKKSQTAADLRAARDSIDLGALSKVADVAAAERRAALLDGSDDEIAKLEQKEAVARRDVDRANAAIEELDRRIAIVAEKEALAEWRASRAAIIGAAEVAAKSLRERYPAAARELAEIISAAETVNVTVRDWNQNRANNWPEGATEQDRTPLKHVESLLFDGFHEDGHNGSLIQTARLLELGDFAPGLHDYGAPHRGSTLKIRSGR